MSIYENKRLSAGLVFLKPLARSLSLFLPNLDIELKQSGINAKKHDFILISIFLSIIYAILVFSALILVFNYSQTQLSNYLQISIILSILIGFFSLFSSINYPKLMLLKKIREIDNALLFALRHVLIKIKSGIPFYDAIVTISYSDYGQVSNEFKKIIKDIQAGASEVEAFEKISKLNPSPFFRKFTWQVTNSLRAGTDISTAMQIIVDDLQDDRYIKIKEFGNKLSPLALMYIIFTVIFPAIILTIFSITSFFFDFKIGDSLFFIVPSILAIFNLFFLKIIDSILPPLSEDY